MITTSSFVYMMPIRSDRLRFLLERISAQDHLRRNALWALIALTFLLCFRPMNGFDPYAKWDELCYLEWLYRFLGLSLKKGCPNQHYFPGTAIAWLPAGWLGILFANLTSTDVDHWIPSFIALTSYGCWAAAIFLVLRLITALESNRVIRDPRFYLVLTVAFIFCESTLIYSTKYVMMAHALEFLLIAGGLTLLLHQHYAWSLLVFAWLCATRVNDFPIVLLVVGKLVDDSRSSADSSARAHRWLIVSLILGTIALIPMAYMAFFKGYGGTTFAPKVLSKVTGATVAKALFGYTNALLWSHPWWLLCLALGIVRWQRLSWMARGGLVWGLFQLLLIIGWNPKINRLMDRYFIGASFAILIVWLELRPHLSSLWRRVIAAALATQVTFRLVFLYANLEATVFLPRKLAPLVNGDTLTFLKDLLAPMNISPLPILARSWGVSPGWLHVYPAKETALHIIKGPPLWILTLATTLATAGLFWTLLQLRAVRSTSVSERESTT